MQPVHEQENGASGRNNRLLTRTQQERNEQLLARWLLAQDRPDEALDILNRLLDSAQNTQRIHNALEIQALMALAYASCRDMQKARASLQAILPLAHKEGYLRLFLVLWRGQPISLRQAAKNHPPNHDKGRGSFTLLPPILCPQRIFTDY